MFSAAESEAFRSVAAHLAEMVARRAGRPARLVRSGGMIIKVGTAGWSIPRDVAGGFPAEGTALERYSTRFAVTEINSSFHRPHRASTWERWRDGVPEDFRFSVKLPKTITHQRKLAGCRAELDTFLAEAHHLGDKLAVFLVQLPPKLDLDREVATDFFSDLRSRTGAAIACEPRNPSWFTLEADELLHSLSVARVAADPAICPTAAEPGGWPGLRYWRLHGSPVIYRSSYGDRIEAIATSLARQAGEPCWCIFDNTASSAATRDALALIDALPASFRVSADPVEQADQGCRKPIIDLEG